MKRFTTLSLGALLLATGAAMAAGQQHAGHQGHGDDTSHGAAAQDTKEFAALDKNKDGALSTVELAKHRLGPHFGMLDSDRDGRLSAAEFAAGGDM
ncbi:MAG TPA: hypothetical protein VGD21_08200 [Lysobacter sp.]